jgi:hypothetical protein
MTRFCAFLFSFVVISLGALSCTPVMAEKCKPENCSGCCSAAGDCLAPSKQTNMSCGNQGVVCKVCLPTQTCSNARCLNNADGGIIEGTGGGTAGGGSASAGGAPSGGGTASSGGGTAASGGGAVVCGNRSQPCCDPDQCYIGLSCIRGTCDTATVVDAGTCGGDGESCCAGNVCLAPQLCTAGTCTAPVIDAGVDAGALKVTGEACQNSSDCREGLCQIIGFQNGYCTKGCTSSTQCIAGSQCGRNPSGVGPAKLCLKTCTQPNQSPGGCRAEYVCDKNADTSQVPVCFPKCTSNTMCGTAPTCDSRGFCCGDNNFACCENATCVGMNVCTAGTCKTTVCGGVGQACCNGTTCTSAANVCSNALCVGCGGLGQPCCASNTCTAGTCTSGTCQNAALKAVGLPCAAPAECAGNTCFSGGTFSSGYCTQDCTSASCGTGTSCSPYVSADAKKYCLKNCQWDGGQGDCRTSYVCDRNLIPGNSQATCVGKCTNATTDCPAGIQCQNGFCCGKIGFKCCAGNSCSTGTCGTLGYCQ